MALCYREHINIIWNGRAWELEAFNNSRPERDKKQHHGNEIAKRCTSSIYAEDAS